MNDWQSITGWCIGGANRFLRRRFSCLINVCLSASLRLIQAARQGIFKSVDSSGTQSSSLTINQASSFAERNFNNHEQFSCYIHPLHWRPPLTPLRHPFTHLAQSTQPPAHTLLQTFIYIFSFLFFYLLCIIHFQQLLDLLSFLISFPVFQLLLP